MSQGRDAIAALPELPLEPFELAGTPGRSRRGPFPTIVPEVRPAPEAPKTVPVPHHTRNASFRGRSYYAPAIYPGVISVDPPIRV